MAVSQMQEAYDYDYEYDYNHGYEPYNPREREKSQPTKRMEVVSINTSLRSKCFAIVVVTALMAAVVLVGNQIIASRGYALVQARQSAEKLELENEHLKVEIAQMKSPQRIKDIAIRKLGMVVPKDVYFATEKH